MARQRLADATVHLAAAPAPSYRRDDTTVSVVHIGLGSFARAHLGVYLDDLLAAGHRDMAMIGVSMRSTDIVHALNAQDGLYTVGVIDGDTVAPRIIGSLQHVLHEPTSPALVRHVLSAPSTLVITTTVTEKGYCTEPATKRLDLAHPDIRHDLERPARPRSLPGQLLVALRERRDKGGPPVTVLSLDNMPHNGRTLRTAVTDLAAATDPGLLGWIDDQVRFPCSMVDRMAPATDDEFCRRVSELIGLDDAWPVRCEPFRQWVVERDWANPMPPLDTVGVSVVDDVGPWEDTKLMVLNGMHTAAAHYGLRHGLETVDAVARDPGGAALLGALAAEIVGVLVPPVGVDVDAYVATTLDRFRNAGLHHLCTQIATDTSQKLPQRLLGTLRERLRRGLAIDALADTLALWAWSTLGRDHLGRERTVDDPMADTYRAVTAGVAGGAAPLAHAVLSLPQIFGDLAGDERLVAAVTPRLSALL